MLSDLFHRSEPLKPTSTGGPPDAGTRVPKRQNPFVAVVALLMIALALGCLWVSFSAIKEKTRLAHALRQIGGIIVITKQTATTDHRILDGNGSDLLGILDKLGQLKTTGDIDGRKTLTNPWGGTVVAQTLPNMQVRIETIVPQRICRRIVAVFGINSVSSNVLQIQLKNEQTPWHTIFTKSAHDDVAVNERELVSGCNDAPESDIALLFDLE